MTDSDSEGVTEPPDIESWLLPFLSVRRREYEQQYTTATEDELTKAMDRLERFAANLVTTGVAPAELEPLLSEFMPGDHVNDKLRELLKYAVVLHRLEFDVAEEVCGRLGGLDQRVLLVAVFTTFLLGYNPSPTAEKYFTRATRLYLAGYDAECVIMCGAVLEAALRSRLPDDVLHNAGIRPIFKRTGDYSIAQRIRFEEETARFFEPAERERVAELINWRNDAVHVQPDLAEHSMAALAGLVQLLPKLLP